MALRRLAWVLALLAVVSVVGTGALALPDRRGPAGHWLEGEGGVRVRVPTGWELTGPSTAVHYLDGSGRVTARVAGPALLPAATCTDGAGTAGATRALVGWLAPSPTTGTAPEAESLRLAEEWAAAVALDPASGRVLPVGAPEARQVRGGHRTDVVVDVPPGPCHAPRARVSVVSTTVPGGVVSLVLVRDLGVDDALRDAVAEEILASVERG